jgi:hypothetical protein
MICSKWSFLPALAVFVAACASYPAPVAHIATAASDVSVAQEAGASSDRQASLYLQLAQDELAQAKRQMEAGKNEAADYSTMRANADAQLALTLAREQEAKTRAADLIAVLMQQGGTTSVTSGTVIVPQSTPPSTPQSPSPTSPIAPPAQKP